MPIYPIDAPKKNGLKKYRVAVSYTDANGKYKQVFRIAYGKDAARELEQQLLAEHKNAAPERRMTFAQLAEEYLAAKQHEVRATTYANVLRVFRLHLLPALGGERLDRLNARRLAAWKNDVAASSSLLPSSRRSVYQILNAFLNWAVRLGYLAANPLRQVGNFKDPAAIDAPAEHLRYYTAEQFATFLAAAAQDASARGDWRYYTFFAMAFFTGMRKGEINALRWADVELDRAMIHVRRSLSQTLPGRDIESAPKTRSSYRDLQIPLPLLEILRAQLTRQQSSPGFAADWHVCGGAAALRDTNTNKKNAAYADAAGLPRIRIHDFRHSHATLLANEGINIQEIARRLGHADVQITWRTYAHLYPREEERAVAILDHVLIPSPAAGIAPESTPESDPDSAPESAPESAPGKQEKSKKKTGANQRP